MSSDMTVDSYVKVDDDFLEVSVLKRRGKRVYSDPSYLEGAIVITINSLEIIGIKEFDYIEQFWSYIIDGLEDIVNNRNWKSGLPDQPTELSVSCLGESELMVKASLHGISRSKVVSRNLYISTMISAAEKYIDNMKDIYPDGAVFYGEYGGRLHRTKSTFLKNTPKLT